MAPSKRLVTVTGVGPLIAASLLLAGCLEDLSGARCNADQTCGSGYFCVEGRCAASCPLGLQPCGSTCAASCSSGGGGATGGGLGGGGGGAGGGSGLPALLTPASSSFDFAGVEVGVASAKFHEWVLRNDGELTTAQLSTSSTGPVVLLADGCAGLELAAGSECTVQVAFKPVLPGPGAGEVIVSGTGVSASLAVQGSGLWRLTVTPTVGGWVESSDLKIANCATASPAACSALFADGEFVTLRARTNNGSNMHFAGWAKSQASCGVYGLGAACQVLMNATLTTAATFRPITANMAFVTSVSVPADVGLSGFDQLCNTLASDAGINSLTGDAYVAWASVAGSPAQARFNIGGGVQRMDGAPLALSRADLLASRIINAPNLTETGQRLQGANESLWTGTGPMGFPTGTDCGGWTSRDAGAITRGNPHGGPELWTNYQQQHPCDDLNTRVVCLENTRADPLMGLSVPDGGRIAFRTGAMARPTSLADADQRCEQSRPMGTPSNSFRALLAVNGSSAWSRFVGNEALDYYRVDGAYVGSGADIKNERLVSGLWVPGELGHRGVWTGAGGVTMAGTMASTCDDWSSVTGTVIRGESNTVAGKFFFSASGQQPLCDTPAAFYCLQQ